MHGSENSYDKSRNLNVMFVPVAILSVGTLSSITGETIDIAPIEVTSVTGLLLENTSVIVLTLVNIIVPYILHGDWIGR